MTIIEDDTGVRACPACGDHSAHKVKRLECNSCGGAFITNWERPPSTPIKRLLAEYAAECSDFSGEGGYAFAMQIVRRYAAQGPDSQLRCAIHTLLNPPPRAESHDRRPRT
jgi:hypothetical protein